MDSLFGVDRIDVMVAVLHGASWLEGNRRVRWPADHARDRQMVQKLIRENPEKDVLVELRKWAAYVYDKTMPKEMRPRARITTWFCYAKRYGPSPHRTSSPRRQGSTVGGTPSTFTGPSGFRDW